MFQAGSGRATRLHQAQVRQCLGLAAVPMRAQPLPPSKLPQASATLSKISPWQNQQGLCSWAPLLHLSPSVLSLPQNPFVFPASPSSRFNEWLCD